MARHFLVHRVRTLGAGFVLVLANAPALAAPFVPLDWQTPVKAGPLVGEKKHLDWIRDANGDLVDDELALLPPGTKTDVIVQLSDCIARSLIPSRFGSYGTIERIGKLVTYVVLGGVDVANLSALANESGVAAVEAPQAFEATLDTSSRAIRAKDSVTFTPETFEADFGFDGTGVNVAVLDTGVDDAVHAAFTGKFVSGLDATTATPGNPDSDDQSLALKAGPNGICNTAAAGDDVQLIPVGQGTPNVVCVGVGPNGLLASVVAGASDDFLGTVTCDGVTQVIATGPNGICNSTALGDDYQVLPVGNGNPGTRCVSPGANGVVDTVAAGDDVQGVTFHGTHVAGIVLGSPTAASCRAANDGSTPNDCQGVAPGSGLVDVKVLDSSGSGTTSDIIDGLEFVFTDGNAKVVNMSLGNNSQSDGTETLSQMIDALVSNDISVAVAAGNSFGNCLGSTAAASLAVTVASADDRATVDTPDDVFSAFSTFGPRIDFSAIGTLVGMLKPDVTAPGTGIFSARGEVGNTTDAYHPLSGTSMASPHVAGAMALLLDMRPDLPAGSMKDLLKRTALVTPQHTAAGPSFPAVDSVYNANWGFGQIDLWQAGTALQAGIADMSFTACIGPNPAYPTEKPCALGGGTPFWANSADVQLATDPPIQGQPNTISLSVENRTATAAQNVTVCVGVRELGAGLNEFYGVGCQEVDVPALGSTVVSLPWTPTFNDHQCIQATIDYGFDTQFDNNLTQRNTSPVSGSSPTPVRFRVENPFNEPIDIQLAVETDDKSKVSVKGIPPRIPGLLPESCPVLVNAELELPPGTSIGTKGFVRIHAIARSASHPQGVELSGVQFDITEVAAGLERVSSVGGHGPEGAIPIPLKLAGTPTSDPRRIVQVVDVVFNVVVKARDLLPSALEIKSAKGNPIPPFTLRFLDGPTSGRHLLIEFREPLVDQDRYTFDFGGFVDLDGDSLTGDTNVDLRVVQGDANGSGTVTATDVSFVRGRIGQAVMFGDASRADENLTGTITAPDASFVRARIGHAAP